MSRPLSLERERWPLANPAFVVVSCERFPDGACECDRACFPLDLERRRPFGIAAQA